MRKLHEFVKNKEENKMGKEEIEDDGVVSVPLSSCRINYDKKEGTVSMSCGNKAVEGKPTAVAEEQGGCFEFEFPAKLKRRK